MGNKYKNNHIRTIFFVTISFLYLLVFENDSYGSASYSHGCDLTKVEAIFQPELPKEFQAYQRSFSPKQRNAYGSFYLENIFNCKKKRLLDLNNIRNAYFSIHKNSLPLHPIISILQKQNTWHQSSDDDASLPG